MRKTVLTGAVFTLFICFCLYLAFSAWNGATTSQVITEELYSATKKAALTIGNSLENTRYVSVSREDQALADGRQALLVQLHSRGLTSFRLDQFVIVGYSRSLNRIDLQAKITYAVPGFVGIISSSASALVSDAINRRAPARHVDVTM